MSQEAKHERRPLRVPFGTMQGTGEHRHYVDGFKVVKPGDPGYDEAFATATHQTRYGHPMPYAD